MKTCEGDRWMELPGFLAGRYNTELYASFLMGRSLVRYEGPTVRGVGPRQKDHGEKTATKEEKKGGP